MATNYGYDSPPTDSSNVSEKLTESPAFDDGRLDGTEVNSEPVNGFPSSITHDGGEDDDNDDEFLVNTPSYNKHLYLGFAALIIAFPFGVLALLLAVSARSSSRSKIAEERHSASKEAKQSLRLSISGIVIAVIVILIAVGVSVSQKSGQPAFDETATTARAPDHAIKIPQKNGKIQVPSIPQAPCHFYAYKEYCFDYRIIWDANNAAIVANETSNPLGNVTTSASLPRCRFGVVDVDNASLCYYNSRYNVSGGLRCRGDLNVDDQFCYLTQSKPCQLAANYHNGICYPSVHPAGSEGRAACRHGFYADGFCYYDQEFPKTDVTCQGEKGDYGWLENDDGYCYSSSEAVCRYAENYHDDMCYDYVFPASKGYHCTHGHVQSFNCYYRKAKLRPLEEECEAPTEDRFRFYCYSNQ